VAFRFHKAFRLGELVRLNVGKKSASLSVGVPGFHVNVGSRGSRATFGVPGTGLSYSTRLGASSMVNHAPTKSTGSGCVTLAMLAVLGFWGLVGFVGLVRSLSDPKADVGATVATGLFVGFLMACTVALCCLARPRKEACCRGRAATPAR
jgi:hypothetical protein